jgi:hypothetical protein
VDEETQKQMMAYAYKKQEELKVGLLFCLEGSLGSVATQARGAFVSLVVCGQRLEEADEDAYLNAPWADSSALKRQLQGTGNVRAPNLS